MSNKEIPYAPIPKTPKEILERSRKIKRQNKEMALKRKQSAKNFLMYTLDNIPSNKWVISPKVIKEAWYMLYKQEELDFLSRLNRSDLDEILNEEHPSIEAVIGFDVFIEQVIKALIDPEGSSSWSPVAQAWCKIYKNKRARSSKKSSEDLQNVIKFCEVMQEWINYPKIMRKEWEDKEHNNPG